MRMIRFTTLLVLIFVLVACGRRLPDEYFDSTSDVVAEAVEEDTQTASGEEVADTNVEAEPVSETDAEESDTTDDSEPETIVEDNGIEVDTDEEVVTDENDEAEVVESEPEQQFDLVEVPADPIIEQVANADPSNGEALMAAGIPCSSCHNYDSEAMLVGPGFLNIPQRAENRIEDQVAERYLYNSILHPNDYIVEGFAQGVMPAVYADTYSEQDTLDIVAYLMTLGDYPEREPVFIEVPVETTSDDTVTDDVEEAAQETIADDETEVVQDVSVDDVDADAPTDTETEPVTSTPDIDLSDVPANVDFLAEHGSVIQGAALFSTNLVNEMSCSTCHSVDGNPSSTQSDLSRLNYGDELAAYIWAATFSEQSHPDLGTQYTEEISGAQASHLLAYLISVNQSTNDE